MSEDEPSREQIEALVAEAERLRAEMAAFLPGLAEARRNYYRTRSAADEKALEDTESRAKELFDQQKVVLDEMQRISGIPDEVFEAYDDERVRGDTEPRMARAELTVDKVASTGIIDELLPDALDAIIRRVSPKFPPEQDDGQHRLTEIKTREPLSLVKGIRSKGEQLGIHRFLQAIRLAEDYLAGNPEYDHFGGAMLVPQLTMLGLRMPLLDAVGGDVDGRLEALWRNPSAESDAVAYELLVAAGCAERGRSVEFIGKTSDKSPDLRSHDPFPLLIECKRKRALSDYELEEEQAMRRLFDALDAAARARGVWGRFEVDLSVEANQVSVDDTVATLLRLRLAAHPDRPLQYPWGSVSFVQLPRRRSLPGTTRTYSPNMLRFAFDWNTDLPDGDGIICRVDHDGQAAIDEIVEPVALVWGNHSDQAVRKRSWGPTDVFGKATNQITPGEFGIIYVAYHEGARAEIADLRLEAFTARLKEWTHSTSIRVPIAILTRLFPRPLAHGNPDLIESGVRLISGVYGQPLLFEAFPTTVFTERRAAAAQDE